jgi:hypothetical protein
MLHDPLLYFWLYMVVSINGGIQKHSWMFYFFPWNNPIKKLDDNCGCQDTGDGRGWYLVDADWAPWHAVYPISP